MTLVDDDPETFPCYRHPSQQTALQCGTCDRPICVDCAVTAAVGIKCPDCARTSRAARGAVPVVAMTRGVAAGTVLAFVAGSVLAAINIPFAGLILAWLAGSAVGEVTRRASGGYRDPSLARIAAGVAALGMVAVPVAWVLGGSTAAGGLLWPAIGAAVAAYGAFSRAS